VAREEGEAGGGGQDRDKGLRFRKVLLEKLAARGLGGGFADELALGEHQFGGASHCRNVSGFSQMNTEWDVDKIVSLVEQEPEGLASYMHRGYCPQIPSPIIFITMSEQRSGSTWFKEMLNGHPCLFMYGEMFMKESKRKIFSEMLQEPQKFIERIPSTKPPTCEYWAKGMKAFYYTTAPSTTLNPKSNAKLVSRVLPFLRSHNGRFIHLDRDDFLARFISEQRTQQFGGGHCQKIEGCDPRRVHEAKFLLDIPKLKSYLNVAEKKKKEVEQMISGSGIAGLHVRYDDLRSSPTSWCKVLNHLGISCMDLPFLQSSLSKDIVKPKSEVIQNFAQVQSALKGSRFEWMLTG